MIRFVLFFLLLVVTSGAHACGCSKPTKASDPHVQQYADIIFVGEVIDASTSITAYGFSQTLVFKVDELFRGPREETFSVSIDSGGTSCDLRDVRFHVGERYLMSAFAERGPSLDALAGRSYYSNFCCLNERLPSDVPSFQKPEVVPEAS